MKKTLVGAVTMAVVALTAIFAFSSPAAAAPFCNTGSGSTILLNACTDGTARTEVLSGCKTGHFEIYNHEFTSDVKNSQQATWCGMPEPFIYKNINWIAYETVCSEFWYLSGSTWTRWGTIVCVNAF